eukprot:scaffold901_cov167-Amphora_coffeaeformis.AAC.8
MSLCHENIRFKGPWIQSDTGIKCFQSFVGGLDFFGRDTPEQVTSPHLGLYRQRRSTIVNYRRDVQH